MRAGMNRDDDGEDYSDFDDRADEWRPADDDETYFVEDRRDEREDA